ncbi:hypothetical protein [Corynebacterium sp.]|uniref:hypothetical protein n=1 Tax=Corynebacterium sp. TaxID=1720 RepID=UPI0025BF0E0E|nr:hypothetical protein [Corynebacterium sp.]
MLFFLTLAAMWPLWVLIAVLLITDRRHTVKTRRTAYTHPRAPRSVPTLDEQLQIHRDAWRAVQRLPVHRREPLRHLIARSSERAMRDYDRAA